MAIQVGSVEVDIVPNTRGIYAKLKEGLVPAATDAGKDAGEAAGEAFGPAMRAKVGDIGLSIGEQIGQQIANRIKDAIKDSIREGVTKGGQAARPAAAKQGEETGGAFARSVKARLEAAFKSLPKAHVALDETGVDADLARLRARMETLSGKRVGIDVDVTAANAEIADIEARLRVLGESHPNVAVRVDTAAARAQLIEIREAIAAVTADPAAVRIDVDGSFGARLRAVVAEAQAALPDVTVDVSTRAAVAQMQGLRADLALLAGQRVGIDIDAGDALTSINSLQVRLTALSESTTDVDVRVDAARAAAALAGLQAQVDALDATPATVHVGTDVDRAGGLARRLRAKLEEAASTLPQLDIGLGTAGADAGIARIRARLTQLASTTIGVDVSVADADAKLALLEGQLERLGAAHPNVAVSADAAQARATLLGIREEIAALTAAPVTVHVDTDGAFGAQLRASIAEAQASLPEVQVDVNTRPAIADIQSIRADLDTLAAQRVGIDIDATSALATINALQARLAVLAESGDVDVRVNAARAAATLATLQAQVDALDATPAVVRVDVDVDRAGAAATKLRAQMEGLFRSLPKLDVGLGTEGVDAGIARIRAKLEQLSGRTIGVDISAEDAEAKLGVLEAQLQHVGAAHPNAVVRADVATALAQLALVREELNRLSRDPAQVRVETDGSFGAKLRASVAAAQAALPDISIQTRVDTTAADLEVAHLRAELGALADQRVGIDIEAAQATARIEEIRARLDALSASDADVAVRVDAAAASARLAAVQAQVSALNGKRARIDVDAGSATSAMLQLGIASALVAAPPAIPVILAGLGAITAAAVAAAVGVGALAAVAVPAFMGIAKTLQAQKAAQDAAATASLKGGQAAAQGASRALQMAGAQQALASAHRNAARQITQAEQAVADAVRSSAEANRQASQQVQQAHESLADAVRQAADRQEQAAESVSRAEGSLADAQRSSRQAQVDLTQARKDAAAELADLENRLVDARLSERDATLDVQDAQARLRATQAVGSKATLLEQQRAQLEYDRAVQRLKEQQEATKQLGDEKAAADKAGVEGSATVQSAQQRLADAEQAVADQQRDLAKARRDATEQQVQSQRDIADAQEKVAEASRNVSRVQEDGARSVERAQESLVAAQESAADSIASAQRQIASSSLSAAGGVDQAAVAQAKYRAELAKLTPEARDTMNAFVDLKGAFGDWSKDLQPEVMPLFTRGLKGLKNILPGLTPLVKGAADGIGELMDRASAGFKKPWWKTFKKDLDDSVKPAIVGLGTAFGLVFKGMAGVIGAFLPHMDDVSDHMEKVTGKFADWGTSLKGSPEFEHFLDYSAEMAPVLSDTFGDIFDAIFNISRALSPISKVTLDFLAGVATGISLIAEHAPWLIEAIYGIIIVTRLWTIAQWAFDAAAAANPIGLLIFLVVALTTAIIYAYFRFSWFRKAVQATWDGIKKAALWTWNNALKPAFDGMISGAKAVGDAAVWMWRNAVQPVFSGIALAAKILYQVVAVAVLLPLILVITAVIAIVKWLWRDGFQPTFQSIATLATWLWRNALSPAFHGIATAAQWLYDNGIKPAFRVITVSFQNAAKVGAWLWRNALAPAFRGIASAAHSLYDNTIKPVFGAIGTVIDVAWRTTIRPTFNALKSAIAKVGTAFSDAKDAIGTAWSKIKQMTKDPINWVLSHVWNDGVLKVWKKITGWIPGVPDLGKVPLLAQGGPLPVQPGLFNQPTAIVGEGNPRYPEYVIPTDPKYRSRSQALLQAAGTQLLAKGGVVGGAADLFAHPTKALRDLFAPVLDKLKPLDDTSWGKMAAGLPRTAIKGLKDLAKDSISGVGDLVDFTGGSAEVLGRLGVARWAPVVQQALRLVGQPLSYTDITLRRMQQESGGDPTVVNRWDSNWQAGHPSVGLMQVIGPTFRAYAGMMRKRGPFSYGVSVDPLANIYASMRYALASYGSLPQAYNRAGGYDSGGYLQPGLNLAYNGTGRPEPVFTTQQANALVSLAAGGGGGGGLQAGDAVTLVVQDGPTLRAYVSDVADGRVAAGYQQFASVVGARRKG